MWYCRALVRGICVATAAAWLAACAGTPSLSQNASAQRAAWMAHAGKPIDQFMWRTGYRRWTAISPDQIVVWTDLNRAYLITVNHPCTNLWFAPTIGFTHPEDTVFTKANFVKAQGWTCTIKTIQPVDYRKMEQDQRQASATG